MGGGERVDELQRRWSSESLATGFGLGGWIALLARHGFRVHPAYWHRAVAIGAIGAVCSVLGALELLVHGRAVREQRPDPPPMFVLGHWRSGTTHLHNLFARDPALAVCGAWSAVFPSHLLLTGNVGPKLLARALPATRTYDQVAMDWSAPAEDEIALLKMTGGRSFYAALLFPDDFEDLARYVDFGPPATDGDRVAFLAALDRLVRKLMVANGGRRVVLKSCPHTARLRLIARHFPTSRFVYVHRHPARVFASMLHMRGVVDWENFLQRPRRSFVDGRWEQTARLGEVVFSRYLEDRAHLPPDQLVEVAYDDLCGAEVARLGELYERLSIPGWERAEPIVTAYVATLTGYRRNVLPLDAELLRFVHDRWRFVYEAHGYPVDPGTHL